MPVDALEDVVLLNRDWIPGERLRLQGESMALYAHIDDCLLLGGANAPVKRAAEQAVHPRAGERPGGGEKGAPHGLECRNRLID